jgi:hypothetical protein
MAFASVNLESLFLTVKTMPSEYLESLGWPNPVRRLPAEQKIASSNLAPSFLLRKISD